MQTITIDPKALAAVRIFAADMHVRYYLNAVYVEATAGFTRLVATDGHILGLHDHSTENELGSNYVDVLLPLEAIDGLKAKPQGAPLVLRLAEDGKSGSLSQGPKSVNFTSVDGRFPQYHRVIPERVSNKAAQFFGGLLVRIHKAQQVYSKTLPALIWHSGTDGALFQLQGSDSFVGVMMPMRVAEKGKPEPTPPDTSRARTALQSLKREKQEEQSENEDLV